MAARPFEDGVSTFQRNDFASALWLWRPLADQGIADFRNNFGVAYAQDQGVSQSFVEAVMWWRKIANERDALAQSNLGVIYATGLGVPQDYVQAYMWFTLAAVHYSAAETESLNQTLMNRDEIAGEMTPAQIAEARRLAREWKPK